MIELQSKVGGRYRFSRVAGATGEVREQTPWIDNLITNNGLDLMNAGDYLVTCCVGSGSTAPADTDTALASLVASTTSPSRVYGRQIATSPFYIYQIATFEFAEGAAAGNLAEVGVGVNSTNLFSRALIKDGGGSPTTITVLGDEFLRVEYELRVEIPETDTTGTFDIGGTTYTWTGRAANIDSAVNGWAMSAGTGDGSPVWAIASTVLAYDGSIGAITADPSGTTDSSTSVTATAYTAGDYESSAEATWGPTAGNFGGGIGAVRFQGSSVSGRPFRYQIGFSPKIPKTDVDQFTLSVSHSWTRA